VKSKTKSGKGEKKKKNCDRRFLERTKEKKRSVSEFFKLAKTKKKS
jgi:hypothetical protein